MPDGFGVSFAPTAENAMDGARQGSLEGLPAAIKILSLRMPRFLGARGIAPDALLNGDNGGVDPFASSVMQTIFATLAGNRPAPPVITPGTTGRTGGTLETHPEEQVKTETGTTMPGPEQRPRRIPREPGMIIRGNPL